MRDVVEISRGMERIAAEGRARAVSVSNVEPHHLERLLAETDLVPVVHQIELHPSLTRERLRRCNADHATAAQAWSPIGRGLVLDDPLLEDLAASRATRWP